MLNNVANSLETPSYLKRKIVVVLISIIIFAVTIEIWVANRVATFGEKINELEATKYSLQLENDFLENKIAQKKSLNLNQKKSIGIGFGKIKKIEYIKLKPIALNPNQF